jgi:hypothetical protein
MVTLMRLCAAPLARLRVLPVLSALSALSSVPLSRAWRPAGVHTLGQSPRHSRTAHTRSSTRDARCDSAHDARAGGIAHGHGRRPRLVVLRGGWGARRRARHLPLSNFPHFLFDFYCDESSGAHSIAHPAEYVKRYVEDGRGDAISVDKRKRKVIW